MYEFIKHISNPQKNCFLHHFNDLRRKRIDPHYPTLKILSSRFRLVYKYNTYYRERAKFPYPPFFYKLPLLSFSVVLKSAQTCVMICSVRRHFLYIFSNLRYFYLISCAISREKFRGNNYSR